MSDIKMIAAITQRRIIGVNGTIPWMYQGDMKYFKEQTEGHIVVMGRHTWDSLPSKVRPLPNRHNVVLTSRQISVPSEVMVANSMGSAFAALGIGRRRKDTDVWLMGGYQVYKEGFKYASELHLTIVPDTVVPDVLDRVARFPNIPKRWYVDNRSPHPYESDLDLAILKPHKVIVDD